MSATADIRGLKRLCTECGARFYDMNKRPIVCPGCQTEFTGDMKIFSRGNDTDDHGDKASATAKKSENKDDGELDLDNNNIVSLNDADDDDAGYGGFNDDDDDDDGEFALDDELDDELTGLGDLGKDLSDLEDDEDESDEHLDEHNDNEEEED